VSLKSCQQIIAAQTLAMKQEVPANRIKIIALIFVGIEWLFVILFVVIGFVIHTHEGREYYATPTPVRRSSMVEAVTDMTVLFTKVLVLDWQGLHS
jgi:uncharacterized protein with PQ loop repeat